MHWSCRESIYFGHLPIILSLEIIFQRIGQSTYIQFRFYNQSAPLNNIYGSQWPRPIASYYHGYHSYLVSGMIRI